ncbi:MAG: hypothetical protein WBD22_03945 [Pyrinomonadaceae bacterium]
MREFSPFCSNMIQPEKLSPLVDGLPDPESSRRFFEQFTERHPSEAKRLERDIPLMSDVLSVVSFSPLFATTLIQHPEYIHWLGSRRRDTIVAVKDELLESIARFSMVNSQIGPQVLLSRFRRRELLRIFLRDIRRLSTIAEITEEIANLADAVLEFALAQARQELENRFGAPLQTDEKGRAAPADLCIVSIGKLGSRELNYSSDIDLLFIYSAEGSTSGQGSRGVITNREYFIKLAEAVTKLVGGQSGEGPAYRVDLRLRPHGSLGSLALSLNDTVHYYKTDARRWELQTMIRSRASAGRSDLYKQFFTEIQDFVFRIDDTVEDALKSVRESKQQIDKAHGDNRGFNVKLGRGGIRDIEFLAQALQLAHGGRDRWLRSPHTLISLSRLADRKYVSDTELTHLFDAYDFLRRTEHLLQMEHGRQTHTVPNDPDKRSLLGRRMGFTTAADFENALRLHTGHVSVIFDGVFNLNRNDANPTDDPKTGELLFEAPSVGLPDEIRHISPRLLEIQRMGSDMSPDASKNVTALDPSGYLRILRSATVDEADFRHKLTGLRTAWARIVSGIIDADVNDSISLKDSKSLQAALVSASIETALAITYLELGLRYSAKITSVPMAVIGLGKLGGGGVDYDSDLDLVLVYDEDKAAPIPGVLPTEFYGKAVDTFITVLSGITRGGSMYRVDLRLRPHGKSGPTIISKRSFFEYMSATAAIWELLAYVKLRSSGGDDALGSNIEARVRDVIHERAMTIEKGELSEETQRVRRQLELRHTTSRRADAVDIKFGPGGMLDIYFAVRYLQLRDNVRDDADHRSTEQTLNKLLEAGSLLSPTFSVFQSGYDFLSKLDHAVRLTIGRRSRLPVSNRSAMAAIANKMHINSPNELLETLTSHRLEIRNEYETVFSSLPK